MPNFGHLRRLTDHLGIWEHAHYATPLLEHGLCTDDNARALVVVSRQPGADLVDLAGIYLSFVLEARTTSGWFHNRRAADGSWTDDIGSDDCQGRVWWGLGTVARLGPEAWMRREGAELFETCTTFESSHLRSNAYAALGAVEIVASTGRHQTALDLIDRSTALIAAAARSSIPWPEPRLTYDNARIPEALIAAGWVLEDQRRLSMGLRLLNWLVEAETHGGHFSFTGVGGREPGGQRPAFDQQPIEAWAMTDACYRAWSATGDAKWRERALCAASWLLGKNDTDAVLYDRSTGATCDGLTAHSRNENCGAESTLSGLGTLQTAARCLWAAGGAGAI